MSPVSSSFTVGSKPFQPLKFIPSLSCYSLKFRNNQSLAVCCEHSCFEVWLEFWEELKWKNYSIAGLSKRTSGSIFVQRYSDEGKPNQSPEVLSPERVGLVYYHLKLSSSSIEKD